MQIIVHKQPKFAIDIESMLALPASVFWKDCNGVYLGCNDVMVDLASLSARVAVEGINDAELVGAEAAQQFIDNDLQVLKTTKPLVIDEHFRNDDGMLIKGFSTKAPLFDDQGELAGLFGISFLEVVKSKPSKISTDIINQYDAIMSKTQQIANRNKPINPNNRDNLSAREIQCLQMVTQGLTAKAIGERLEISKRTVEAYIDNVKSKLGCFNKTELIITAIKRKYVDIDSL